MLYESTHIRIDADDQIATLTLDFAGQRANGFNLGALDDLEKGLKLIHDMPWIDLLIVRSAKLTGFSPGHQLEQLLALRSSPERAAYAGRGQQVLQLFSALPKGTCSIAYIEGVCDSAGLELALACHYRVAVLRPDVTFAFPEVERGAIPCWGGTQRLHRRVGVRIALNMLLNGQRLSAGQAYRAGLLDRLFVDPRARIDFRTFLDELQDSPDQRVRRRDSRPWLVKLHDKIPFLQDRPFHQAEAQLQASTPERPAAGKEALRAVQAACRKQGDGLARERQSFAQLGGSVGYRHILQQKQRLLVALRIYPEAVNPAPPVPKRIGIVGAGALGTALAQKFLLLGHEIVVREAEEAKLVTARKAIDNGLTRAIKTGLVAKENRESYLKAFQATCSWHGFEDVGLVIEAVDEDLGIKRLVFDELEKAVRPRTILATASTTIRVELIQAELQRPNRVAGLHFVDSLFSTPIVELVRGAATDSDTLSALASWLPNWNCSPVLVADLPGRLIQRVRMAYWSEALLLVAEGLPPELVDREMRRFGMKRGPLETIDAIGFDYLAELARNMQFARGDRFARNLLLKRMRSFGFNGRAGGEGFYTYRRGKVTPNPLARMAMWRDADEEAIGHYIFDPEETLREAVDRLVFSTINEAAKCLGEESDADPASIDLVLSLGADWSPQKGGPLRYADEIGLEVVAEQLNKLADRCGRRFEPCLELQRRAEVGETFHGTVHEAVVALPELIRKAG
jgi:3-hydroxyacyl-CoA dehydrogenase/enoyl-CoA hydratase/3-hydroxybutyryl-CoA epimerase